MLQSMLVGLDGSPYSTTAIEFGIQWAKKFNAVLVGLGVIDEPTIRKSGSVPIGGSAFKQHRDDTLVAEARDKIHRYLEQFTLRCADVNISSKILQDVGLPSEQILLESQRYDLIILGKQTYYHFETQDEPDETLTQVLKNSPRPVVTVPEKLGTGKAIVIAYDGSLQAARTLQALQTLCLDGSVPVHVVVVHDNEEDAILHADRPMDFLLMHQINAQRYIIQSSSPAEAILEHIHQFNGGLLAMGAYGKSSIREFFFGSVTRKLLRNSTIPLFLYH